MLPSKNPKLTLADLKLGMQVKKSQLSEIYDTYIILTNVENTEDGLSGQIGFIGKEVTNDVAKLRSKTIPLTCVYNNSDELGEDIYYEG